MRTSRFPYPFMKNIDVSGSREQYIKPCFWSHIVLLNANGWEFEFLTLIYLQADNCGNNLYLIHFCIFPLTLAWLREKCKNVVFVPFSSFPNTSMCFRFRPQGKAAKGRKKSPQAFYKATSKSKTFLDFSLQVKCFELKFCNFSSKFDPVITN